MYATKPFQRAKTNKSKNVTKTHFAGSGIVKRKNKYKNKAGIKLQRKIIKKYKINKALQ